MTFFSFQIHLGLLIDFFIGHRERNIQECKNNFGQDQFKQITFAEETIEMDL